MMGGDACVALGGAFQELVNNFQHQKSIKANVTRRVVMRIR